jgi:PPM family protein phosphatase
MIIAAGATRSAPGRSNEDSYLIEQSERLYMVADGVGSRPAASEASRLAIDRTAAVFLEAAGRVRRSSLGETLLRAVEAANAALIEEGRKHPEKRGMATALSALALSPPNARIVHIGDTRVYHLCSRDALTRLTKDHTSAHALLPYGSNEQLRAHPLRRHLLRALGLSVTADVDAHAFIVEGGSRFLICSDGLSDVVEDSEIQAMLAARQDVAGTVDNLMSISTQNGTTDDVSVVVVDVMR